MTAHWLTVSQLADLAGLTERAIRLSINASRKTGKSWRGASLATRIIGGNRGGKGGISYEVAADSLPPDLFAKWQQRQRTAELPPILTEGPDAQRERQWWFNLIMPILRTAPLSSERGQLVKQLAGQQHVFWTGDVVTFCERSIRRRVNAYTDAGMFGLSKRKRNDIGKQRALISWRWQKACGLPLEKQQEIHDALREYVRQLHRTGVHRSGIIFRAKLRLFELSKDAGSHIAQQDCDVSRWFTDKERHYQRVNRFERDRKAHEDAKPRIIRTHEGMRPMDLVFGDVHHLDFDLATLEGFQDTVKSVGWYDYATGRIHLTLFRLPKGQSIRNEHVIDSFMAMVTDWGLPKQLYLDNGGEFNFAEFIDDALKLTQHGLDFIGGGEFDRQSQVIRAKPYNAAAKPIEGAFNILTNHIFPPLPGWRGGSLGNKKTPNVNRAIAPYLGTFDEFARMVGNAVAIRHEQPQGGRFKGQSPNDLVRQAVADGWTRTTIKPDLFWLAFCKRDTRKIDGGMISYAGQQWHCDALDIHMQDRVVILAPKYTTFAVLPVEDLQGNLLGFASPAIDFHPLDQRGAQEAGRRQQAHNTAVRQLGRSIPPLDVVADNERIVALLPGTPAAPKGDTINPTEGAQRILDGLSGEAIDPAHRRSKANRWKQIEALNRKRKGSAA